MHSSFHDDRSRGAPHIVLIKSQVKRHVSVRIRTTVIGADLSYYIGSSHSTRGLSQLNDKAVHALGSVSVNLAGFLCQPLFEWFARISLVLLQGARPSEAIVKMLSRGMIQWEVVLRTSHSCSNH